MFISLGYFSKKMIIPLLIPLIYIFRHNIIKELNKGEKISIFLNTFIVSLSYLFNIILLIIENKSVPNKKKTFLNQFINQLLIERKRIEKEKTKKKFIFLFIISFCNFLNFQVYDIVKIFKPDDYNEQYFYAISITFFFLSTALMSYLFLDTHIYNHQKLSLIISPILSAIMCYVFINNLKLKIIYLLICLLLRNFRFILMVFGKLFMEKYFISKLKILSFFGIIGLILSLIINILAYFLKFDNIEDKKEFENNKIITVFDVLSKINKIQLFIAIILWFLENHLIWFCISELSPNHYIIYRNISSIFNVFKEIFKEILKEIFTKYDTNKLKMCIVSFIALIGMFICGLIFNELIIIRICGFDKYTAFELDKRQKEETENSFKEALDNEKKNISDNSSENSL